MIESVIKDESAEVSRRVIFFCVVMGLSLLAAVFMFFSVLYLPNVNAYPLPNNPVEFGWETNIAIYHIIGQFKAIFKTLEEFISSGTGFIKVISQSISLLLLFGCVISFLVPLAVCAVSGIMCAVNKRFSVNRILIAVWLVSAVSFFVISNMVNHGFEGSLENARKVVSWGAVFNVIFALGAYCTTFFNTKKFKLSSVIWAGCGALSVLTVCLLTASIGGEIIYPGLSNMYLPQSIFNRFMYFIRYYDQINGILIIISAALGLVSTFGVLISSLAVPVVIMFLPKDKKFTAPILIVICALVTALAFFSLVWMSVDTINYNKAIRFAEFNPLKINATVPFILILSILNTYAMTVAPILLKKIKKY